MEFERVRSIRRNPVPAGFPVTKRPAIKPKEDPQKRKLGRGVSIYNDPDAECVCSRPKAIVFCRGCGHFRIGRKRTQCSQHPTVLFLYDIDKCEKCNASFFLHETKL